FQAEDGIRDLIVTGVQTCALPILIAGMAYGWERRFTTGRRVVSWGETAIAPSGGMALPPADLGNVVGMAAGDYHGLALKPDGTEIGRASCRERVEDAGGVGAVKSK